MHQQIQSFPTPFIWWPKKLRLLLELENGIYSLDSVLVVLPVTRNVVEDFPPNAAYGLDICNVNQPIPLTRTITEDFPPFAAYSLVSVIQLVPVTRNVTEDFPPSAAYSLVSVIQLVPITETLTTETANAGYSLQSVVA